MKKIKSEMYVKQFLFYWKVTPRLENARKSVSSPLGWIKDTYCMSQRHPARAAGTRDAYAFTRGYCTIMTSVRTSVLVWSDFVLFLCRPSTFCGPVRTARVFSRDNAGQYCCREVSENTTFYRPRDIIKK